LEAVQRRARDKKPGFCEISHAPPFSKMRKNDRTKTGFPMLKAGVDVSLSQSEVFLNE
jgi:hypothetical protein